MSITISAPLLQLPAMASPRFFMPFPLSSEQSVNLPADVTRHIHVLRLQQGDAITLFDGNGGEYPAMLTQIGKHQANARTGEHRAQDREARMRLTLAQGIAGGDKMDWLIEKAVELGVHAIQPVQAARSVVRLSGDRATRRIQHWQALVRAASEQCGRNRLAEVRPPQPLSSLLSGDGPPAFMLSPRGHRSLGTAVAELAGQPLAAGQELTIWVGPEGGWSDEEEERLAASGCEAVTLGPRILRTETAGLAVLAAIQALTGGFD